MKETLQWVDITPKIIESLTIHKSYLITYKNGEEKYLWNDKYTKWEEVKEILLPIKQDVVTDEMIKKEAFNRCDCNSDCQIRDEFIDACKWMRSRMTQQPKQEEEWKIPVYGKNSIFKPNSDKQEEESEYCNCNHSHHGELTETICTECKKEIVNPF